MGTHLRQPLSDRQVNDLCREVATDAECHTLMSACRHEADAEGDDLAAAPDLAKAP